MKQVLLLIGSTNFKYSLQTDDGREDKKIKAISTLNDWLQEEKITNQNDRIIVYFNNSVDHKFKQSLLKYFKKSSAATTTILHDTSYYNVLKNVTTHFPLNAQIFIKFGATAITIYYDYKSLIVSFLPFNLLDYEKNYTNKFKGRYLYKDFLLRNIPTELSHLTDDHTQFINEFLQACKSIMVNELKSQIRNLLPTKGVQVITIHGGGAQYFYLMLREEFPSPSIVIDYIAYGAELKFNVLNKFANYKQLESINESIPTFYIREDNLFGAKIILNKNLEIYLKNIYAKLKLEIFQVDPTFLERLERQNLGHSKKLPLSRLEVYRSYNIYTQFSEEYLKEFMKKNVNYINESPPHPCVVIKPILFKNELIFEPIENCLATDPISGTNFVFKFF